MTVWNRLQHSVNGNTSEDEVPSFWAAPVSSSDEIPALWASGGSDSCSDSRLLRDRAEWLQARQASSATAASSSSTTVATPKRRSAKQRSRSKSMVKRRQASKQVPEEMKKDKEVVMAAAQPDSKEESDAYDVADELDASDGKEFFWSMVRDDEPRCEQSLVPDSDTKDEVAAPPPVETFFAMCRGCENRSTFPELPDGVDEECCSFCGTKSLCYICRTCTACEDQSSAEEQHEYTKLTNRVACSP